MGESNDISQMLALLHELQGIDFVRQLRLITERHEFSPLKDDPLIYTVGGSQSEDYQPLLDAARLQSLCVAKSQGLQNGRFHL